MLDEKFPSFSLEGGTCMLMGLQTGGDPRELNVKFVA